MPRPKSIRITRMAIMRTRGIYTRTFGLYGARQVAMRGGDTIRNLDNYVGFIWREPDPLSPPPRPHRPPPYRPPRPHYPRPHHPRPDDPPPLYLPPDDPPPPYDG